MDIEQLCKLLKDIILEEDSVSLPGLGTLVAEIVPASFTDRGYTINPPYRHLSFIPTAGKDKFLAKRLAKSEGIKEAAAEEELGRFLAQLKEVLKARKAVILPGLGKLRATRENHFFFVPDQQLDIYPEGFGLNSISLKNHEETAEEIADAVSDLAEAMAEAPVPEQVEVISTGQEPAPVISTEQAPSPVISTEQAPSPVISTEQSERRNPIDKPVRKKRPLLTAILIAAALCIVFLGALAILGRTSPDFVDRFLYSADELQTLKSLNL